MTKSKYEGYVVRKPVYEACPGIKNRQSPTMTFISDAQVAGVKYYLQIGWINGIPDPNPHVFEHMHDFDEVMLFWGGHPDVPQDLGGEIEYYIGGQPVSFNTTTGIFIPRGTRHGPLTWKGYRFPHVQMSLMLGTGKLAEGWSRSGIDNPNKTVLPKTNRFDYEQYVVRSPMREAAPGFKGFQSPTMTYMSSIQVNPAKLYIDLAWVSDIVEPGLGEHVHNNNDEIVLHLGSDPNNPEDLGADMVYGLGGDLLEYNTSYAIFIPRGLRHGPLSWKKVRKAHMEIAIVFGVGTLKERSEGTTRLPTK